MKLTKVLFLTLVLMTAQFLAYPVPLKAATTISITSPTASSTVSGTAFTVTGTATANRKVEVKINGTVVGNTTSDGSGNWSLAVTNQTAGPKTIEATASTQLMFTNVLNTGDFSASRMSKINVLNNQQEGSFSIFGAGAFPITWKPNPTYTKAYGVAPYLNSATVWDMDLITGTVTTFTLPGVTPRGASIAYNTDGSKVYITDNANTTVYVYNTSTNAQIGGGILVGGAPHSNAHRPGTNEIWLANSLDGTISVIDTTSDSVIQTYAVGAPPNGLAFSPDGETAYIGLSAGGGSIGIVQADTGITTNTMVGTADAELVVVNSDNTKLYVSHPSTNTIDVFDIGTASLEATVTVGTGAWGMALTADDSRLYVTSPNLVGGLTGTTISIIDTSNNTVVDTITPGGGAPFFIWAFPVESASASLSFTLTSATLADTGDNLSVYRNLAVALLITGAVGGLWVRTRRSPNRQIFY